MGVHEKRVGFGSVGRLHVGGIPVQQFAAAQGDAAEQHRLGQLGTVSEVRARRRPAFAGIKPVAVGALAARKRLRRLYVGREPDVRDESRGATPARAGELTLVADKQNSVTALAERAFLL